MDLTTKALEFVSTLSSGPANAIWAAVISAYWLLRSKKTRDAVILFFGTTIGSISIPLLKNLFAHPRPPGSPITDTYSFPSGHALSVTLISVLFVWLASRHHPNARLPYVGIGAFWVGLVGYSRIYLGAHYVSDVIAGYIFGVTVAAGVLCLSSKLERTHTSSQ